MTCGSPSQSDVVLCIRLVQVFHRVARIPSLPLLDRLWPKVMFLFVL